MPSTVSFLEFEQPLNELQQKLDLLHELAESSGLDVKKELISIEKKQRELQRQLYEELTPWQATQVARHPQRPYSLDYINGIFTDFQELHGDRHYADDLSIVGGLASLDGIPCMVIGHQKGRDVKERTLRNFGMPRPEGYRKAERLMKLAEKFQLPIFTFIDTPGAYPGIGAEERGQSEAIGKNLFVMTELNVPIIATIIGEGGSGGALALAVADTVLMLQNAIYSVISPEGCASILWKSVSKASEAARILGITADRLLGLKLVDGIVPEPMGGAHRDSEAMMVTLKNHLLQEYYALEKLPLENLKNHRYEKIMAYGSFTDLSKEEYQKSSKENSLKGVTTINNVKPKTDKKNKDNTENSEELVSFG